MPRIDCNVEIASASSCWLLKTGDGVGGDFRMDNRSDMIKHNVSIAVIVGLTHVVGKKSPVLDDWSAFDLLMKHT